MTDELIELPKGWKLVNLGDIIQPSKEKINPVKSKELSYIGLEHIEKDTGRLLGYGSSNQVKSTKSKFYTGDLLYGKLRPYLNKLSVAKIEGICSTDILVFPKTDYLSNQFLAFRFLAKDFVEYASNNVSGVQHPRVNFETLSEFSIFLPPLNEQKRIVDKIEALQERSQRVKAELEAIRPLLNQFRQSVLAAAFRGDLTKDWREKNPDIEPASVLLERIKIERRRRWEEAELEKMKAAGKTPKNDKWKQKYKEPLPVDTENLPELPDGWCWVYLDVICEKITDGEHITPPTTQQGIHLLSAKNVRDEYLDFSDTKFVDLEVAKKSRSRCNPEINDVLVVSRGATVGRSCLIATHKIFCLMGSVLLFKFYKQFINPKMVNLFFKSPQGTDKLISLSGASAQQAIYIRDMKSFAIAIPPLEEQKEIVKRIDKLFKIADNIEQEYQQVETDLETLNQSILAKAFRGELVPQDPNDEPASVLLERIRAEREANSKTAKKAKKTRRKTAKKEKESTQLKIEGIE